MERVPSICPHDLFADSSRASQLPPIHQPQPPRRRRKGKLRDPHGGARDAHVGDNRLRHETLQRFMLANDSVTVAVEMPIWLAAEDIEALEIEHGIGLLPEGQEPRVLTGHIDFLQVRNGAVHILDYKPDARTNKPIAQLTLYALALTRLAGSAPVRHQMRLVQRGAVLRVLPARIARAARAKDVSQPRKPKARLSSATTGFHTFSTPANPAVVFIAVS